MPTKAPREASHGVLTVINTDITHFLVAIDKFTKWIEAKLIAVLKAKDATAFFLDIVYRFGVPNSIITGNGK